MLFMWEEAKQHQVTRLYLSLLGTALPTFVPGVGPPAKISWETEWKRLPLLAPLCECSAPVLHGDSTAAPCGVHLWKSSPEP